MPLSPRSNLNDLLSDASFRLWVKTGDFKKTDNNWSRWRRVHPQKEEVIQQAIHILLASHLEESVSQTEVDEIVAGTWQQIHQQQKQTIKLHSRLWWAAASVTIVLGGIWLSRGITNTKPNSRSTEIAVIQKPDKWNEQKNAGRNPLLIMLSDSSSVVLLSGGVLKYPDQFSDTTREVQLTGEAFFEISKNSKRPFLVHTNTVTTRVVGTSFTVRAYDQESQVKVTVKTGRVSVYPNSESHESVLVNTVLLHADQNIIYNKTDHKMQQSPGKPELAELAIRNASFEFTDTPVTAILDSIASVYGLKMNYESANLKKCILTTSLTDVPLLGKLKIICRALGPSTNYEVSAGGILIKGQGCDL